MTGQFRPTILSALVLGCSMFGDTFLYAVLPTNAESLHVPVMWIGFLLSINRIMRLFLNQLFAMAIHRYGLRNLTIIAAVLSVLSTFLYGIATGIVIWIVARTIWAMSYAALRISASGYCLTAPRKGLGLGLGRGLQETGPLLGLALGSALMNIMPLQMVFFFLAGASLFSVVLACRLPDIEWGTKISSFRVRVIPSSFNLLVFLCALLFEGMLVVVLGKLLMGNGMPPSELAGLCALFLALRRVFSIFISPFAGLAADRWSVEGIFFTSVLLSVAALMLIYFQFIQAGIIVAFAANSVTSAMAPGAALYKMENPVAVVAANATWRDAGAALGALAGGWMMALKGLENVFLIATFALLAVLVFHGLRTKLFTNLIISWK